MAPDLKRAKLSLLGSLIAAVVRIKVSTGSEQLENHVELGIMYNTSGAGIQKVVFSFVWSFGSFEIHEF